MVFSSSIFLFVFLPALLVLYYNPLFKGRTFRNYLLLVASLGFYAWGETVFVFIMLFSIAVNYFLALKIDSSTSRKKLFLTISVVWNVLLIFVFKYFSFTMATFLRFFRIFSPEAQIPIIEIPLPIGISFFTFQIMSYVFDVYYQKVPVQKRFADLALYISFFPQLIAGPIVRYETIAGQIQNRKESAQLVTQGTKRFAIGLAKKCLVANYVAIIADATFSYAPETITSAAAWLGAICYSLQIYFDFSGYSDMAIGLGKLFGFSFEENFNYPYVANSITDFWRRWHISLSSWFKNYVYIPLGGSRCSKRRNIFNLFVVWTLTGIWHGAALVFCLWGLYYFALLLFERRFGLNKPQEKPAAVQILWRICTLVLITIGWVLFRSDSAAYALRFVRQMFCFNFTAQNLNMASTAGQCWPLLAAAIIGCTPILQKLKKRAPNIVQNIFVVCVFALSLLSCISNEYSPFIYFNF